MSTAVWQIAGLALFAGGLLVVGARTVAARRETPEQRERRRRKTVNTRGRLGDGTVTDADANTVYYSYAVGGVEYRASQDVTQLAALLPSDPNRLIGPVTLKYSPRNPENSILICETWSGLRATAKEVSVP